MFRKRLSFKMHFNIYEPVCHDFKTRVRMQRPVGDLGCFANVEMQLFIHMFSKTRFIWCQPPQQKQRKTTNLSVKAFKKLLFLCDSFFGRGQRWKQSTTIPRVSQWICCTKDELAKVAQEKAPWFLVFAMDKPWWMMSFWIVWFSLEWMLPRSWCWLFLFCCGAKIQKGQWA